jgi:predicted nucleic acid-binding protein
MGYGTAKIPYSEKKGIVDAFLVDTNIVSYLFKGHSLAEAYRPRLEQRTLCIAFITVAGLFCWAEVRHWGARRKQSLGDRIRRDYLILPQRLDIAEHYALIAGLRRSKGKPISVEDALIAASALAFGLPLATHNPKDFEGIPGLVILTEHS